MAIDRIFVSAGPGETRVALCDGEHLAELIVERDGDDPRVGDIYLGRVEKVMGGLGAAFVDIGAQRSGFLPLPADDDAFPSPNEGDAVLVQIVQEPFEDKGAKLTSRPALAGRFLVYTPEDAEIRISRRIEDEGERGRLEEMMEELCDEDEGVILRTSAAGVAESTLEGDLDRLSRIWSEIEGAEEHARVPSRLYREPPAAVRVLRDEADSHLAAVVVDDSETMRAMADFCAAAAPEFADLLSLHDGPGDLFEAEGIEEEIDTALSSRVPLPSGGDIVVEETAALTAIDVNSGGYREGGRERAALAVNLEAVAEIAYQIRLRNIGGLILCDMIGMKDRANGARLLSAFEEAVAADKVSVRVAGFTRMGLVELVRDRKRIRLSQLMLADAGEPVRAPEAVAFAALRAALREARHNPGANVSIAAAPSIAAALQGTAAAALKIVTARLARPVAIRADVELGPDGFRIDTDGR
jgi:ribonuclease G